MKKMIKTNLFIFFCFNIQQLLLNIELRGPIKILVLGGWDLGDGGVCGDGVERVLVAVLQNLLKIVITN